MKKISRYGQKKMFCVEDKNTGLQYWTIFPTKASPCEILKTADITHMNLRHLRVHDIIRLTLELRERTEEIRI